MKRLVPAVFVLLLLTAVLTGCDRQPGPSAPSMTNSETSSPQQTPADGSPAPVVDPGADADAGEPIELVWDALIPADWRPETLFAELGADGFSDDDPRAQELMDKLQRLWKESPVVEDYNGLTVKLPGFVVPLDMDATSIREFLLVPYYGACIHTPPPPANQTVYVVTEEKGAYTGELFDTVWVTGTLRVERLSSDLGEAGYRIEAHKVEPYDE